MSQQTGTEVKLVVRSRHSYLYLGNYMTYFNFSYLGQILYLPVVFKKIFAQEVEP